MLDNEAICRTKVSKFFRTMAYQWAYSVLNGNELVDAAITASLSASSIVTALTGISITGEESGDYAAALATLNGPVVDSLFSFRLYLYTDVAVFDLPTLAGVLTAAWQTGQ